MLSFKYLVYYRLHDLFFTGFCIPNFSIKKCNKSDTVLPPKAPKCDQLLLSEYPIRLFGLLPHTLKIQVYSMCVSVYPHHPSTLSQNHSNAFLRRMAQKPADFLLFIMFIPPLHLYVNLYI